MTIAECIGRVDSVKPNQYSTEEKVRWLSYLDASIRKEIIERHELPVVETPEPEETTEGVAEETTTEFTGYSTDRLTDKLIAPFPYDELYVAYLKAKIDEENGETAKYNNSASAFNGMLQDFQRAYHREHMPLSVPFRIYN